MKGGLQRVASCVVKLRAARRAYSGRYGQPGLFDAFMGFEGDPTALLDYGLCEACAGCELLDECMSFAPYCATSEEAKSMAEYALPR